MTRTTFQLADEFIALNRLLKAMGVCESGGAAKALVASGAVTVDRALETRKSAKIRAGQSVRVGDLEIDVLGPETS